MLQNAYFLAKIGADTAENEQHFAEILPKTGNYPTGPPGRRRRSEEPRSQTPQALSAPRQLAWAAAAWQVRGRGLGSAKLANFAKFCKFLAGSFSAVSERNFARKYAFDSTFQALQDVHTFAPLQTQHVSQKIDLKHQQLSYNFSNYCFANCAKSANFANLNAIF